MRRLFSAAALGGLLALALPVPSAHACTPALPALTMSRETVTAGATLRLAGAQYLRENGWPVTGCDRWTGRPPGATPPTESPGPEVPESPSPTPLAPLPPLPTPAPAPRGGGPWAMGAATPPLPPLPPVAIAIRPAHEWDQPEPPSRPLGTVTANPPVDEVVNAEDPQTLEKWTFTATVRIPGDLAPGKYEITAGQAKTYYPAVFYGYGWLTVVDGLSATGGPTTELLGIALLSVVSGAYALSLSRRAAATSPRRASTRCP